MQGIAYENDKRLWRVLNACVSRGGSLAIATLLVCLVLMNFLSKVGMRGSRLC